jgi:hypothetical protein
MSEDRDIPRGLVQGLLTEHLTVEEKAAYRRRVRTLTFVLMIVVVTTVVSSMAVMR